MKFAGFPPLLLGPHHSLHPQEVGVLGPPAEVVVALETFEGVQDSAQEMKTRKYSTS